MQCLIARATRDQELHLLHYRQRGKRGPLSPEGLLDEFRVGRNGGEWWVPWPEIEIETWSISSACDSTVVSVRSSVADPWNAIYGRWRVREMLLNTGMRQVLLSVITQSD